MASKTFNRISQKRRRFEMFK